MHRPLKPKTVGDISARRNGWTPFSSLPSRVNLATDKTIRIPITHGLQFISLAAAAVFSIFGSVTAPTMSGVTKAQGASPTLLGGTASSTDAAAEQQQLQSQLSQLEGQINQYQGQIASYQSQGKSLSGQIAELNDKIASLNLQIQAINLTLSQLDQKISETQSQIDVTQADIQDKKTAIGGLCKIFTRTTRQI